MTCLPYTESLYHWETLLSSLRDIEVIALSSLFMMGPQSVLDVGALLP